MAKAPLPFGMGKFPIAADLGTAKLLVLMIAGFMVFHLTDDAGNVAAQRAKAMIASATGVSFGQSDGGSSWGTA